MNHGLDSIGKYVELKQRLFFLLLALIVYRLGSHIPVPGIDSARLVELFRAQGHGMLALFDMFSGGALERFTVFALGIMPYISASIIIQLLSVVLPSLEELKKEGESGRRKLTQYTRYGTVLLGTFQALGIGIALQSSKISFMSGPQFLLTTVVTLVTGTLFLMWLGEQITERGVGNGISMLIFAGIVSGLPSAVARFLEMVRVGQLAPLVALFVAAVLFLVITFIVFMERAQRKIPIHYAKRQVGNKVYGMQTSHLPLKINMSGVISPIFASSLILFPATLLSWFGSTGERFQWLSDFVAEFLSPGSLVYILIQSAAIIFFCFFYTALVFNPRETADNLKKSGAFVPGIRPGDYTAQYIDKVITRLTLFGSFYIVFICSLPLLLNMKWNIPFYLGGTSLLIVVVVAMDFMGQLQSFVMSQHYDSVLKKANFKKAPLLR